MKKKQRIITASVTVLAAAVTAHLMQRGSDDVARMAAVAPASAGIMAAPTTPSADLTPERDPNPVTVVAKPAAVEPMTTATPVEAPTEVSFVASVGAPESTAPSPALSYPEMPRPPKDASMPAPLPAHGSELRSRMATVVPKAVALIEAAAPEVKRSEFGLSCGAMLTALPKDAAMVGLTLTDPCRGNQVFTLEHGPLTFTASFDQLGTYKVDVPALSADALFAVRFDDGEMIEAQANVPMADQIDRVALFTNGQAGLGIHALEFGADYEQDGHVWSGSRRDAGSVAKMGGGFVTLLGDNTLPQAQLAEVYTFPANTKHREGVVRLSIEAEVTAFNCGKDIAGQTLQKEAGQVSAPVSLTLAMPDCDAIGEFLVLKNLLRDLRIASN